MSLSGESASDLVSSLLGAYRLVPVASEQLVERPAVRALRPAMMVEAASVGARSIEIGRRLTSLLLNGAGGAD